MWLGGREVQIIILLVRLAEDLHSPRQVEFGRHGHTQVRILYPMITSISLLFRQ